MVGTKFILCTSRVSSRDKSLGWKCINEWTYFAHQLGWDSFIECIPIKVSNYVILYFVGL